MTEVFRSLDNSELEFIRRAMIAVVNGGFFHDREFKMIFGIERADLLRVIEQWPEPDVCGDGLRAAVVGSLNHLSNVPHDLENELLAHLPEGREAISEMMKRGEIFVKIREFQKQLNEMIKVERTARCGPLGPENFEIWKNFLRDHIFYNEVGFMIAKNYKSGNLDYDICDRIMNILYFGWLKNVEREDVFPSLFLEIFEAFDAGKCHHKEDKSNDPVKDYTDPQISKIIAQIQLI